MSGISQWPGGRQIYFYFVSQNEKKIKKKCYFFTLVVVERDIQVV